MAEGPRQKFLKDIFLTYSQCPVPPKCLLDFLQDLLKDNMQCCCISQELHQDGGLHLHAYVKVKERLVLNREQFAYWFDLNYDDPCYHPNVQPARNVKKVVGYVMKGLSNGTIQDFVEWNMNAQAVINKQNPKNGVIAKLLLEGKSIKDCFDAEPGYVGFNLQKVQYLHNWLKTQQLQEKDPWQELDLNQFELNSPNYQIATWLNNNINKKRVPRTPHLMIVGGTLLGKSLLISKLRNYLNVYRVPAQGPYFPPWEDGKYGLIAMEELRAGWTVSDLLLFLDGSPTVLKIHGGLNHKNDNVPIIITSNQTFEQSYHRVDQASMRALLARVQVIEISEMIDVFPGISPKN